MGLRKKWHGVGTKVGGLAYRGDSNLCFKLYLQFKDMYL